MSPTSAIRTSIDKGFRLRSRSEVEPRSRAESVSEARRKFYEKEKVKEERAALEEVKALEKQQQKEAKERDRQHRRSSASERARSKRSKSEPTSYEKDEGIFGRDYDTTNFQTAPLPADEPLNPPRRINSAKRKTHSTWTTFVMWLRTRFL